MLAGVGHVAGRCAVSTEQEGGNQARGQWHTLWNAGETPCEIIEIISPSGFENYFRELATIGRDVMKLIEINRKYELEMDFMSVPNLSSRCGLTFLQP